MSDIVRFTAIIRTVSEANRRDSRFAKSARTKKIRGTVNLAAYVVSRATWAGPVGIPLKARLKGAFPPHCTPTVPLTVTIVRVAPRPLDIDNAWGSAKAAIDGLADALNLDDGDYKLTWRVEQRRGLPEQYELDITIEPTPEAEWKPAPVKKGRK